MLQLVADNLQAVVDKPLVLNNAEMVEPLVEGARLAGILQQALVEPERYAHHLHKFYLDQSDKVRIFPDERQEYSVDCRFVVAALHENHSWTLTSCVSRS